MSPRPQVPDSFLILLFALTIVLIAVFGRVR